MGENQGRIKCQLCGGTMPEEDVETRVEHMLGYHQAKDEADAKDMASKYFVRIKGESPGSQNGS
jgi:hypothetical protein